MAEGVIIREAYLSFEQYPDKRIDLASPGQSKSSKLHYIQQVVLSAFDEVQGKVQKLQAQFDDITQALDQRSDDTGAHHTQVTDLLNSIQDQTSSLRLMSADYKAQLDEAMEQSRQTKEEEMETIQGNVERIEVSQGRLVENLQLLTEQIDKQYQESTGTSSADAEGWAALRDDAEEQTESLEEIKDATTDTIKRTTKVLDGLGDLSGGDPRLAAATTRLSGIGKLYEFAVSFIGSRNKSNRDPKPETPGKPRPYGGRDGSNPPGHQHEQKSISQGWGR
ncbi:MAG: hypothetical protein Q9218_002351 [Villophora microphyllina]